MLEGDEILAAVAGEFGTAGMGGLADGGGAFGGGGAGECVAGAEAFPEGGEGGVEGVVVLLAPL